MRAGERSALEGLLGVLKPGLAVEIGVAQGGSTRRLAAHAGDVHAFDVVAEAREAASGLSNVTVHIGDSGQTVPAALEAFAAEGRHVDFALVDGDHSAEGVRRDAASLLASPACARTVIVFHDAANDEVRAGLGAAGLERHPKVGLALLDFVPGYLVAEGERRLEIWNGLALVVLDAAREGPPYVERQFFDAAALLGEARRARSKRLPSPPESRASERAPRAAAFTAGALLGGALASLRRRRR